MQCIVGVGIASHIMISYNRDFYEAPSEHMFEMSFLVEEYMCTHCLLAVIHFCSHLCLYAVLTLGSVVMT